VSVGAEGVAGLELAFLEAVVIFDDAVVDDGDFAGLVEVRMGIFIGGRAVGGPAGVADAEAAGDGLNLEKPGQALVNLALLLADFQSRAIEDAATPALS
jgi:hypothetical protein